MKKILSLVILILIAVCVLLVVLGLRQDPSAPANHLENTSQSSGEEDTSTEPAEDITATLAVCGDIMSHSPQTNDAYNSATDTYSYAHCFTEIQPWVDAADYAVGNLETTLNGPPYSGYPQFCAPDALATDLKSAGFDMLTTANNHSMDKGFNGVCRTLDTLDAAGLKHVGTYRTQEEFDTNKGIVVADVGGISVAFLGYTYGTNGIPIPEENRFCLNCFNTDYKDACSVLDEQKIADEMAYAETLGTDLIAVMVHWGIEYQTQQNEYQDKVADCFIKNGADLILGSHSHVPQPMMTRTVTMDDGSSRSAFVCYSLGNFLSNQSPSTVNVNYTDTTALLNVELTKSGATGETTVSNVSYVPLLVLNRGAGASDQYAILDVHAGMTAHENGNTSEISDSLYEKLNYALEGCHSILGAEYDTAQAPGSSGSDPVEQAEPAEDNAA